MESANFSALEGGRAFIMAGSTISGTVAQTVVLGRHGHYRSPPTITATGVIEPVACGADGIDDPSTVRNARIINDGIVVAAAGGTSRHRAGR